MWEIVLCVAITYWNLSTLTIWLPLTPAKKSSMPSFKVEDSSANSPEPWRKKTSKVENLFYIAKTFLVLKSFEIKSRIIKHDFFSFFADVRQHSLNQKTNLAKLKFILEPSNFPPPSPGP